MAAESGEASSTSKELPLEAGALYTVQERLDTFKVAHCSWPFDSGPCTPLRMAEAGFYFCGTDQAPDWVRCVVCHHDMEGWESTDEPLSVLPRILPGYCVLPILPTGRNTKNTCLTVLF